jgi:hypothetical protein
MLQAVLPQQARDRMVVAAQLRNDLQQAEQRLAPASLSLPWLPATTLAGSDPFQDRPDPLGTNPNGSRAGWSVSHRGRPGRCGGRMSKATVDRNRIAACESGGCYSPALAG